MKIIIVSLFTILTSLFTYSQHGTNLAFHPIANILKTNEKTNEPKVESPDNVKVSPPKKSWLEFSELDYELRFFEINKLSPIDFDFNASVKYYIDYYLTKRPDLLSKALGLSNYYFPLFEESLDKYNLPLELKYLAVIESALNPIARSRSGAIGLWQFKYNTALMMDLEINNFIDERQDPIKSTDAACRYLEFLYNTFEDWQLALAAYNGGPGMLRNALARSNGKKNYWDIRSLLPTETQGYVPGFLAMAFLLTHAEEFNIKAEMPSFMYNEVDTIMINNAINLTSISDHLNIPLEQLKFLNPIYKRNYIPKMDKPMPLVLPKNKINDFFAKQSFLSDYSFPSNINAVNNDDRVLVNYVVKSGDYMNKIALNYRCSIDDIVKWNNLSGYTLFSGQKLKIWTPKSNYLNMSSQAIESNNNNAKSKETKQHIYVVQEGDSLYRISTKFEGVSVEDITQANNINNPNHLIPGRKIIVPVN